MNGIMSKWAVVTAMGLLLGGAAFGQKDGGAGMQKQAKDIFYGPHNEVMNRIGRERGWPPSGRAQFEAACAADGHLVIGDAERVAEKIVSLHRIFRNDRILIQMAIGAMPHAHVLRAIEIMGTKVAPLVRAATS